MKPYDGTSGLAENEPGRRMSKSQRAAMAKGKAKKTAFQPITEAQRKLADRLREQAGEEPW